jgi:hypothetical protein
LLLLFSLSQRAKTTYEDFEKKEIQKDPSFKETGGLCRSDLHLIDTLVALLGNRIKVFFFFF